MPDASDSPLIPAALRDALRLAPANTPLLLHVADTLLRLGGFAEAETLFKRALALEPASAAAKLGLATAFFQQGKQGAALVLVEDMVKQPGAAPRVFLLHARLALQAGEPRLAAQHYLRARDADPALADLALEAELAPHLPKRAAPTLPKNSPPSASPPAAAPEIFPPSFGPDADDSPRERLPAGDLPAAPAAGDLERPAIKFADVGGMERV
ncbi:MAG: hypothetical protein RLZZ15_2681, partial [Verrucomicrobiota bacterium]